MLNIFFYNKLSQYKSQDIILFGDAYKKTPIQFCIDVSIILRSLYLLKTVQYLASKIIFYWLLEDTFP